MHSLDEPLDLKLSITKLRAAREKRERTLGVVRHHTLHRDLGLVDDSPTPGSPGSPPSGFLLNPKFPEKVDGRFSAAPLVDLSLSPPSGLDSPNGSSSLSPERQGNGDLPPVPTAPVRRAEDSGERRCIGFQGLHHNHHTTGRPQITEACYSLPVPEAKV